MDKETELRQFTEQVDACIGELNALLQSTVVCKNERVMLRVNRFKKWLLKTKGADLE